MGVSMKNSFLPTSRQDMDERSLFELDFILITGDATVDHPSFGVALIGRWLEHLAYSVGVIAQPCVDTLEDMKRLGRPRLGFLVSGGNIDSMVSNYSSAKKRRSRDVYGAQNGTYMRPDYAATVYSQMAKKAWADIPVILGGLEASLRRFSHYDYWSETVKPSILHDSGADLLVYGMGEYAIREIAEKLRDGMPVDRITDVRGTCYLSETIPENAVQCPSHEDVSWDTDESKKKYAKAVKLQAENQDHITGEALVQAQLNGQYLIQNPPMPPISQADFDLVYSLPYVRAAHPMYDALGGVPALEEVQFSIIRTRGCFGACNFCSLAFHQGRTVSVRGDESILSEVDKLISHPAFKGYIHDVGGPTANFSGPAGERSLTRGHCINRRCLTPEPCSNLNIDHTSYLELLCKLKNRPGVKKVFVRSGIRYDYLMADPNPAFFEALVEHHISGQLKVAPEHCSDAVLDVMGKPHFEVYERFAKDYRHLNRTVGKDQHLVPYFISSHPGCTLEDAIDLALYFKRIRHIPQQVQDFYPTPGTISTCMYYTGMDPLTGEAVYVPKSAKEKAMQRALMQYNYPKNKQLVADALCAAGRRDLIGYSASALISPDGVRLPQSKSSSSKHRHSAGVKLNMKNKGKKKRK